MIDFAGVLLSNAYHEAGHAVVAHDLGAVLLYVETRQISGGDAVCGFRSWDPTAEALILFAGEESDQRFTGSTREQLGKVMTAGVAGGSSDRERLAELLPKLGADTEEAEEALRARVREILHRRRADVHKLAGELMRRPFVDGAVRIEAPEILALFAERAASATPPRYAAAHGALPLLQGRAPAHAEQAQHRRSTDAGHGRRRAAVVRAQALAAPEGFDGQAELRS